MNYVLDPLNIFILIAAVAVIFKLRSVLGKRTGFEKDARDTPPPARRPVPPAPKKDNVVPFPRDPAATDVLPVSGLPPEPPEPVWKGLAAEGSPAALGLLEIVQADSEFKSREFIAGARGAYEMVLNAFAEGDRETLQMLLARDVYDGFAAAIVARETAGERTEFKFVGIDRAEVTAAELKGSHAAITVGFKSEAINATFDKNGTLIAGDPKQVSVANDVWVFERDISSRDPNWKLVATDPLG